MTTTYDKEWYHAMLAAYVRESILDANVDTFLVCNCEVARDARTIHADIFTDSETELVHLVCDLGDIFMQTQEEVG